MGLGDFFPSLIARFFAFVRAHMFWIVIVLIAVSIVCYSQKIALQNMGEHIMFALNPTVERAFAYGEKHFSARDPEVYDVARARYFFIKAEEINPRYPYLQHEIARIAFLRGYMPEALARINVEIAAHPTDQPNSYYVRALIYGFMEEYAKAGADYETYFKLTPATWAGINDYAWVLLRQDLPEAALPALEWGLKEWPDNPWLLNNKVTALYELGRYDEAANTAVLAADAAQNVTEELWLIAYPGNDPLAAKNGIESFKKAVADNQVFIRAAQESSQQKNQEKKP